MYALLNRQEKAMDVTNVLGELIRDEPNDWLVHDLRLVVNALDRKEHFAERVGAHDVQLPFSS